MVWHSPKSETASMQRRQKNWLKYTDFTELKKVTSRIHSNCSNYSFVFFTFFKFRCCSFCFIKTLQLTVQVCCLFFFLHQSTFFKGKVRAGFLVGFTAFLKWALKITSDFFWLGQTTQHWRWLWSFSWFSEPNFKTVQVQHASFSWFYDAFPVSFLC